MMRFTTAVMIVALGVIVALGPTRVAAQENRGVLMGVGATPCAQFTDAYRSDPRNTDALFFSWAQGFMSGLNLAQMALNRPVRDLNAMHMAEQMTRIRELCGNSPLLPYAYAVQDLMKLFPELPPK